MALQKDVEVLNSGLFINYWRITHRQDDYTAMVVEVTLHGYRDMNARIAGKEPLANMTFRFGPEAFVTADPITGEPVPLYAVTLPAIYAAVMALPTSTDGEVNVMHGATPV